MYIYLAVPGCREITLVAGVANLFVAGLDVLLEVGCPTRHVIALTTWVPATVSYLKCNIHVRLLAGWSVCPNFLIRQIGYNIIYSIGAYIYIYIYVCVLSNNGSSFSKDIIVI